LESIAKIFHVVLPLIRVYILRETNLHYFNLKIIFKSNFIYIGNNKKCQTGIPEALRLFLTKYSVLKKVLKQRLIDAFGREFYSLIKAKKGVNILEFSLFPTWNSVF